MQNREEYVLHTNITDRKYRTQLQKNWSSLNQCQTIARNDKKTERDEDQIHNRE